MEKIEWRTEKRFIRDLIPYAHNPRKMSSEQVKQLIDSLEKFNYVELIAIQPDNRIIAGHMRIKVLKQIGRGKEEIEVRVPSRMLSDEEMKEYLIRSNRNTGEWDWDMLAEQWDVSSLMQWGFTADEVSWGILDGALEEEAEEEPLCCASCGQKIKKKKAQ